MKTTYTIYKTTETAKLKSLYLIRNNTTGIVHTFENGWGILSFAGNYEIYTGSVSYGTHEEDIDKNTWTDLIETIKKYENLQPDEEDGLYWIGGEGFETKPSLDPFAIQNIWKDKNGKIRFNKYHLRFESSLRFNDYYGKSVPIIIKDDELTPDDSEYGMFINELLTI